MIFKTVQEKIAGAGRSCFIFLKGRAAVLPKSLQQA